MLLCRLTAGIQRSKSTLVSSSLQAFNTHNRHPYSIFPIVPKEWYNLIGHLSLHQLNDAWLSQIAWMLDIVKQIPVEVLHDRADLTGNNKDEYICKQNCF
jgi:hypothetical protein